MFSPSLCKSAFSRISGLFVAFVAAMVLVVTAVPAAAHPLGNFTINHLTRLAVAGDRLDVRYTLDMAEIPTAQTSLTVDPTGRMTPPELAAWTARETAKLLPQLAVAENGAPVALTLERAVTTLRPGAGGLPTIYLTLDARGALAKARGTRTIAYVDGTFATGHIGWRDVVVAPRTEPTRALTAYPSELLGSPRSTTAATIALAPNGATTVAEATAAVSAAPSVPASPLGRSNQLSDMLQHGTGDWRFVALTFLAAIVLGGLHALEPGHGKTLLAVSLVGARATVKQAGVLASALTVAHTIGVLALGALILLLKDRFAPEAIYPWITLVSGCAIAVIGARAVQRQIANRQPLAHAHAHGHDTVHAHDHDHVHRVDEDAHAHAAATHSHAAAHSHDDMVHSHGAHDHGNGLHGHDHGDGRSHGHGHSHDDLAHARSHAIPGTKPLTFGATVLAAMSGGIAPCPAALVVLLAAVALDEVAYGIFVIVAFSAGLATTLTGLGIAVVRGATWLQNRPQFDRFVRYGPLVSAVVIATIGAIMVGQGFAQQGVTVSPMVITLVVAAAIAGYAFSHPFGHAHRAETA